MAASNVRFGTGVTREVGMDLTGLGIRNAVLTSQTRFFAACIQFKRCSNRSMQRASPGTVYDRVRVEPSDESFRDAIAFAGQCEFGAIVAVGGGSTINTTKAVNLIPRPRIAVRGTCKDGPPPDANTRHAGFLDSGKLLP
jgi:hydroxyacid-oxoacid transhydrogenase